MLKIFKVNHWYNENDIDGIYLKRNYWDDFGYKTTYDFWIVKNGEKNGGISDKNAIIKFSPKIKNKEENIEEVNFFVSEKINILDMGKEEANFYTLGNVEYYEILNEVFATEEEKNVKYEWLKNTNDLAYNLELFEKVKKEKITRDSLLREYWDSEVINQLHRMTLGGAWLTDYNIDILDKNENLLFKISVSPNSILPTNLYAIIGKNGTGKTSFLKKIIEAYRCYVNEDMQYKDYKFRFEDNIFESILCISYSPFDTFEFIKEKKDTNIKYIGLIDSTENLTKIMTKNLIEIIEKIRKSNKRFEYWKSILLLFEFEIWAQHIRENIDNCDLKLEIEKLSSGQKIILLSISHLVLEVVEKTLVIIDEPELFLHPPLLKAYIRAISNIILDKNGIAILATHSPIVLQEIPHNCVRETIMNKNGEREIREIDFRTFGENVSTINDIIFHTELRNSGYYKLVTELVEKVGEKEEIEDFLGSEALVLYEYLVEIGRSDEKSRKAE